MAPPVSDSPIRDENLALILAVPARKALAADLQRNTRTLKWQAAILVAAWSVVGMVQVAPQTLLSLGLPAIAPFAAALVVSAALTVELTGHLLRRRRMRRHQAELDALMRRYNRPPDGPMQPH